MKVSVPVPVSLHEPTPSSAHEASGSKGPAKDQPASRKSPGTEEHFRIVHCMDFQFKRFPTELDALDITKQTKALINGLALFKAVFEENQIIFDPHPKITNLFAKLAAQLELLKGKKEKTIEDYSACVKAYHALAEKCESIIKEKGLIDYFWILPEGELEAHQRMQVRLRPSQLQDVLQEAPLSAATLRRYVKEFEIPILFQCIIKNFCTSDPALVETLKTHRLEFKAAFRAFEEAEEKKENTDQFRTNAIAALENAVTTFNAILSNRTLFNGYAPVGPSCWKGERRAICKAYELSEENTKENTKAEARKFVFTVPFHQVQGDNNTKPSKPIPTIPFALVQKHFPLPLFRLIRDIYYSYLTRATPVFDQRSESEQNHKKPTSKIAGSLRSWHLNFSNTLPILITQDKKSREELERARQEFEQAKQEFEQAKQEFEQAQNKSKKVLELARKKLERAQQKLEGIESGQVATPQQLIALYAQAVGHPLHTHYTENSGPPEKDTGLTSPIGYAEYTGTGIQGDAHHSKIVLDYVEGRLFLTLSHYQHYVFDSTKEGDDKVEITDKTTSVINDNDEAHRKSPWFEIVMP